MDSFYRGVKAACDRGIERQEIEAYEPADPAEWNKTSLWHFIKTFYIWRGDKLLQPVVITNRLRNVPVEGIYNWDPGSYFGIYKPDTFWYAQAAGELSQ